MIDYARIGQMINNFKEEFHELTKECNHDCEHCAFGVLVDSDGWTCIHDVLYDIQDLCEM